MILADENIDTSLVKRIRNAGIEINHIKTAYPGISDEQVIELSRNPAQLILTEDKDFGEWVYAHNQRDISVVLLRYKSNESSIIANILLGLLKERGDDLLQKFTTITPYKIRIRSLE